MENTACIYSITNKINGRIYIGATKLPFKQRKYLHTLTLKWGQHRNHALNADWASHGADCFVFTVIEEGIAGPALREREQFWVEHYRAEGATLYNVQASSAYPIRREATDNRKIQVHVSPLVKDALRPMLQHHEVGAHVNRIAEQLSASEVAALRKAEPRAGKGQYAYLWITPTAQALDHAAHINHSIHRTLRAAAIHLAMSTAA